MCGDGRLQETVQQTWGKGQAADGREPDQNVKPIPLGGKRMDHLVCQTCAGDPDHDPSEVRDSAKKSPNSDPYGQDPEWGRELA